MNNKMILKLEIYRFPATDVVASSNFTPPSSPPSAPFTPIIPYRPPKDPYEE